MQVPTAFSLAASLRDAWRHTALSLVAACVCAGTLPLIVPAQAHAQNFPRTLQDVKVFSGGSLESVQFIFSSPYQGKPSATEAAGQLRLNFSGVGSIRPKRHFKVNDSRLLRELEIIQNRYSTTVTLVLRDAAQSLRERINFTNKGRTLEMVIQPQGRTSSSSQASLRGELERIIASGNQASESDANSPAAQASAADANSPIGMAQPPVSNWWRAMLLMMGGLTLMLGLLYLLLKLYRRFFPNLLGAHAQGTPTYRIRVLAAQQIGPRQRILVLDVGGEQLICAATPQHVSLLLHIKQKGGGASSGVAGTRRRGHHKHQAASSAQRSRTSGETSPAARTGTKKPQEHTLQEFSQVLKRKTQDLAGSEDQD